MRLVIIAVACLCAVVAWGQSVFDPGKTAGVLTYINWEYGEYGGQDLVSGAWSSYNQAPYVWPWVTNAFPNRGTLAAIGNNVGGAFQLTNIISAKCVSISYWRFNSGTGSYPHDFGLTGTGDAYDVLRLYYGGSAHSDVYGFEMGTAAGLVQLFPSVTHIPLNATEHLTVSMNYRTKVASVFLNGKLLFSAFVQTRDSFTASERLAIMGRPPSGTFAGSGYMDDLIVKTDDITPTEASQLYRGVYKHETATTAKNPRNDACDLTSL